MIRFIDIESGNTFDGHQPYIFWFDAQQSVNVNYVKKICFASDKRRVTIKLSENAVFSLLDVSRAKSTTTIDTHSFFNLDEMKCDSYVSEGLPTSGVYVHMCYVLGCSDAAGTCTEQLLINDEPFTIGADFYNEQESLSIELANKGVNLPKIFQKAIYESNVHDDSQNNILINRKLKELCEEYINIFGNQGSYKSLINALNWFEYGDLVKLEEYWQYNQVGREMLNAKELTQFVDSEVSQLINNYKKTTFIGLSLALQHLTGEYENDEPVPALNSIIDSGLSKWCAEDLSIKMAIVGALFDRIFMPVHINLIHSTVENVVFTNCIKIPSWTKLERIDKQINLDAFTCSVHNGDVFYLGNTKARVFPDTIFGTHYNDDDRVDGDKYKYSGRILGVEPESKDCGMTVEEQMNLAVNYFEGVGVIVPFNCRFDHIDSDDVCVYATINSLHIIPQEGMTIRQSREQCLSDGDAYVVIDKRYEDEQVGHLMKLESGIFEDNGLVSDTYTSYNISEKTAGDQREISFNLLLQDRGKYKYTLLFHYASGREFTHTVTIEVKDSTKQNVSTYKISKKPKAEINEILDSIKFTFEEGEAFILPTSSLYQFAFAQTEGSGINIYRQFLACNKYAINSKLSTNQIIILQIPTEYTSTLMFTCTNQDRTITVNSEIVDTLNDELPDYKWYSKSTDAEKHTIVGICRDFTHEEMVPLFDGDLAIVKDGTKHSTHANVQYDLHKYKAIVNADSEYVIDYQGDKIIITFTLGENLQKKLELDKPSTWFEKGESTHNYIKSISATEATVEKWVFERFVPLFYNVEKVDVDEIEDTDVIFFMPDLLMTKQLSVGEPDWLFECATTGKIIKPAVYRQQGSDRMPTILGPMFGNYQYSLLPEPGYYNVYLNYRLAEGGKVNTYCSKSEFLIKTK